MKKNKNLILKDLHHISYEEGLSLQKDIFQCTVDQKVKNRKLDSDKQEITLSLIHI